MDEIEKKARELLAKRYELCGFPHDAASIRAQSASRDACIAIEVIAEVMRASAPAAAGVPVAQEPARIQGNMVDGELSVASAIDQVAELFPSADRAALRTLAACFTHPSIHRYTAPPAQDELPRPMDTAPRDGTVVRLLVQFTENEIEDTADPSWTIGVYANGADFQGWQFAGWCWTHDHFTDGTGKPVGWLPMLSDATAAVAECRRDAQSEQDQVAWRYWNEESKSWNATCSEVVAGVARDSGRVVEPLYAAPPAQAVELPYSIDADPAGIRARVADAITGTLMMGAQGHTPPPAGHWLEPFWQAARADAKAQAVDLHQFREAVLAYRQMQKNDLCDWDRYQPTSDAERFQYEKVQARKAKADRLLALIDAQKEAHNG